MLPDNDCKEAVTDPNIECPGHNSCVHQNYPILYETFKDPDTQFEKVVLAISLPGGVTKVKIEINEDGLSVVIKYNRPDTLFDMKDLFKKLLSSKQIYLCQNLLFL